MPSWKKAIVAGVTLFVAHVLVLVVWGTKPPGPVLSQLIQLMLGIACALASLQAAQRSNDFGRKFWRLAAIAFSLFVLAQGLGTYDEAYRAPHFVEWLVNLTFFFWFTPMGMALFLDPESEARGVDMLVILDFTQAVVFGIAAYLYFFYLPAPSQSGTELSHAVWAPYFLYSGILTAAFFLRSFLSRPKVAKGLFGRAGIYLLATGIADYLFYYGQGRGLSAGSWFDVCWSTTLLLYFGFEFPDRFGCIQDCRAFCQSFFPWYNEEHRHSGVGLLTPAMVHYGRAEHILRQHQDVLDVAYQRHPERFVRSAPKSPALPSEVWINKPVLLT